MRNNDSARRRRARAAGDGRLERGVELAHDVVESLRRGTSLKSITLRLGVEQIAEARRTAAATGEPYQAVLRRWVARGASEAQAQRTRRGQRAR